MAAEGALAGSAAAFLRSGRRAVDRHVVGSMEKDSGRKRYVRGGASVGLDCCVVNQVGLELSGMEEGAEIRWWWARRSSHMVPAGGLVQLHKVQYVLVGGGGGYRSVYFISKQVQVVLVK